MSSSLDGGAQRTGRRLARRAHGVINVLQCTALEVVAQPPMNRMVVRGTRMACAYAAEAAPFLRLCAESQEKPSGGLRPQLM